MSLSLSEFYTQFHQEGIVLDTHLRNLPAQTVGCFAPTIYMEHVNRAGDLLMRYPHRALARSGHELVGTPTWSNNTAANILRSLINQSLIPLGDRAQQDTNFRGIYSSLDTCKRAEPRFLQTINNLGRFAKGHTIGQLSPGARIVTNSEGQVQLLQKRSGVGTMVSLRPIYINNIEYPPGSIVSMRIDKEHKKRYLPQAPHKGLEVVDTSIFDAAGWLRLSTLALRPDERTFLSYGFLNRTRNRQHRTITIDSIRDIVQAAADRARETNAA